MHPRSRNLPQMFCAHVCNTCVARWLLPKFRLNDSFDWAARVHQTMINVHYRCSPLEPQLLFPHENKTQHQLQMDNCIQGRRMCCKQIESTCCELQTVSLCTSQIGVAQTRKTMSGMRCCCLTNKKGSGTQYTLLYPQTETY